MASLADNDGAGQIGAQLLTKKKLPPLSQFTNSAKRDRVAI